MSPIDTSPNVGIIRLTASFLLHCDRCLDVDGRDWQQAQDRCRGWRRCGRKQPNSAQPPFLLPAQPTEITEAMEDFRRFVGRKQWEKAFKHLEKVFGATSDGLVLTADGIMLPSRMIAREPLQNFPVPAQDAYRLFFDAEAKKAARRKPEGKEEPAETLADLFPIPDHVGG